LHRDIENTENRARHNVPSLEDIAELFEFLDTNRTGMISANDFMKHFELVERLKLAKFNYDEYIKMGNKMIP